MFIVDLIISDTALREAIAEQIRLTDLGEARKQDDFSLALQDENVVAILLDQANLDKKLLKILRSTTMESQKKGIFILGEVDAEWDCDLITESFSKPLRLGHLIARLQFYLQMAPRLRNTILIFGPYRLEPQNRHVVVVATNETIRLTEKEAALLEYLGKSDAPIEREELLAAIWGYDGRIDTHTLETHIYQLRRKLDPTSEGINWLLNEQGAYRLNRAI